MNEKNQVKSSLKNQIFFILECGILLGLILCLLNGFILLNFYRYPFLDNVTGWPYGILTGIIVMTVTALLRHTTVLVTKNHIIIRRGFCKKELDLKSFDAPVIIRREYKFSVTKKVSVKIGLRFLISGTAKTYRLFGFHEEDLEQVLLFVREQRSINMPVGQKLETLKSLAKRESEEVLPLSETDSGLTDSGESVEEKLPSGSFSIAPEKIRQYEKKNILKIGIIWLALAAAMLVFLLYGIADNGISKFQTVFFLLVLIVMLAAIPFQLLHLSRKIKLCPKTVKTDGNALWIGTVYFSFTGISAVTMTSPRKESDSIFPVQYWLTVKQNGEKHKFWLGSQASFGEYRQLCAVMEQAFVMRPGLLHFKG